MKKPIEDVCLNDTLLLFAGQLAVDAIRYANNRTSIFVAGKGFRGEKNVYPFERGQIVEVKDRK